MYQRAIKKAQTYQKDLELSRYEIFERVVRKIFGKVAPRPLAETQQFEGKSLFNSGRRTLFFPTFAVLAISP